MGVTGGCRSFRLKAFRRSPYGTGTGVAHVTRPGGKSVSWLPCPRERGNGKTSGHTDEAAGIEFFIAIIAGDDAGVVDGQRLGTRRAPRIEPGYFSFRRPHEAVRLLLVAEIVAGDGPVVIDGVGLCTERTGFVEGCGSAVGGAHEGLDIAAPEKACDCTHVVDAVRICRCRTIYVECRDRSVSDADKAVKPARLVLVIARDIAIVVDPVDLAGCRALRIEGRDRAVGTPDKSV